MMFSRNSKTSLNFRLGKIPVSIQLDFLLLGLLLYVNANLSPGAALEVLFWIGISVLVHELGHAAIISYYGLQPSIRLIFLGGVTIWAPDPDRELKPGQQIAIALAGPIAGFILGGLVWIVQTTVGWWPAIFVAPDILLVYLLLINLFWGAVNLLPIYPMDGGQVLNHLLRLQKRLDPEATASWVAIVFIAGLLCYTIWMKEPWLSLILIWMGYSNVTRLLRLRDESLLPDLQAANSSLDYAPQSAYETAMELYPRLKSRSMRNHALAIAAYGLLRMGDKEKLLAFTEEHPGYASYAPGVKISLLNATEGPEAAFLFAKSTFAQHPQLYLGERLIDLMLLTNRIKEVQAQIKLISGHDFHQDLAIYAAHALHESGRTPEGYQVAASAFSSRPSALLAYHAGALQALMGEESAALDWFRKVKTMDAELLPELDEFEGLAKFIEGEAFQALLRDS